MPSSSASLRHLGFLGEVHRAELGTPLASPIASQKALPLLRSSRQYGVPPVFSIFAPAVITARCPENCQGTPSRTNDKPGVWSICSSNEPMEVEK